MRSQELNLLSLRQTKTAAVMTLVGIALILWFMNVILTLVAFSIIYATVVYFLRENALAIFRALGASENIRGEQEQQIEKQRFNLDDAREQIENLLCRNDALDRELSKAFEDQGKHEALYRAKAAQVEALQMRNRNLNSEINGGPPIKRVTTMGDWKKMDPSHQLGEIKKERQ